MKGVSKMTVEVELIPQRESLEAKRAQLQSRTSKLAQNLQYDNQISLGLLQEKIAQEQELLRINEEKLRENQSQIDQREKDTALYIQEQVKLMVQNFLEWVQKNKGDIGYDIKRSFRVAGIQRLKQGGYGEYYYPTGNVGIFEEAEENNKQPITRSHDYYFKQSCYETEQAEYDRIIVKPTDWYTQYIRDFTKAFLEELEKSYNLSEELKLTIKSPEFTLELV